jgi:hypothetical protein
MFNKFCKPNPEIMKNIHLQILASLIGALFLISSCEKEEEAQEPMADPSLTLSSNSFSFEEVNAGDASNVESYTLTGEDLSGGVTVATQAPFAIATSADGTFGQTLSLTADDFATGPVTFYARFEPADTDEGDFTGEITHTTEGLETPVIVTLSGTSVASTDPDPEPEPEPVAGLLVEEDFDYSTSLLPATDNTGTGAGNAAVEDGWVKVRAANDGIRIHSEGLSFAGYPGSEVGQAVFLQFGAREESDVFVNNLNEPQDPSFTGDYYVAYLLQIESFPAKSQFNRPVLLSDWNDNGGALWMDGPTIRNRAAADAAEDDVVFGLRYEGDEFQDSEIVPEIGKTYLVVMKHTVTDTDFTNNNDASALYVFESEVPAEEPATPDVLHENLPDKYMAKGVALLEVNSQAGAYIVDGVRVSNTWEGLFQ